MDLPIIKIDVNGRKNLWGKTKKAVVAAFTEYEDQFDWIFKVALSWRQKNEGETLQADDDTYVIMENLRNLLGHFNSSKPLLAGSIFVCRYI